MTGSSDPSFGLMETGRTPNLLLDLRSAIPEITLILVNIN